MIPTFDNGFATRFGFGTVVVFVVVVSWQLGYSPIELFESLQEIVTAVVS